LNLYVSRFKCLITRFSTIYVVIVVICTVTNFNFKKFLISMLPLKSNYTVFQKSDAKIQITITTAYLTRIKYPLSGFNYHLSDVNVAYFNKIHRTVSEQQLF